MNDRAEYYEICVELDKAKTFLDYYRATRRNEQAKTWQVRVKDITHRKLVIELHLSKKLAIHSIDDCTEVYNAPV